MENAELEKSKVVTLVEIVDYLPQSVLYKTIMKRKTGNISAVSVDSGEEINEKISPFDVFVQIIDGKAEVVIDDKSYPLETGESMIIPAHSSNSIKARVRIKLLLTVIKSGYEDVSLA